MSVFSKKTFFIFILIFISSFSVFGDSLNSKVSLKIKVRDKENAEELPFATVFLKNEDGKYRAAVTDSKGELNFQRIVKGSYWLRITYVGYADFVKKIEIFENLNLDTRLSFSSNVIKEVVVTANETKGLTSSSRIGEKALRHLQPSSFSDVLELLPGGRSKDPILTTPNAMHLREIPAPNSSKYSTSSMGVAFVVDNIPISTDANMQYLGESHQISHLKRNFLTKGVDTRTISTDGVENIEIIRGIPSVEYGNLTSGVVLIQRKRKLENINARFKADMMSKLFSVGKGFNFDKKDLHFVLSLDYLSAKADPRNLLENYKRLSSSIRATKKWNFKTGDALFWNVNLDYTGSFDNDKKDPDFHYGNVDSYNSSYNRYALSNMLSYSSKTNKFVQSLDLDLSFSCQHDIIKTERFVQLTRVTAVPIIYGDGEWEGVYLPNKYVASHTVDGRPFNFYFNLKGLTPFSIAKIKNELKWGVNYTYDKNFGKGQLFDIHKPLFPGTRVRPRPFSDVPANSNLSLFIENRMDCVLGRNRLSAMLGVRASSLLNLEKEYKMHNRIFLDPRVNLKWGLPFLKLAGEVLKIDLLGGLGWHTRHPMMIQLHPDKDYIDLFQLNYYHKEPEYRTLYIKSISVDRRNFELQSARNFKWELRSDLEYRNHQLSIIFFKEDLMNGFRRTKEFLFFPYKRYNVDHIDHDAVDAKLDVATLPFIADTLMNEVSYTTNGSRTLKEGVEFVYSSPRFEKIGTRFSFFGAWFRTTYQNSQSQYFYPSILLGGKDFQFVGLYKDDDRTVLEMCNTTFMADTHIPKLNFGLSLSFQSRWFRTSQSLPLSNFPDLYFDKEGREYVYDESSKTDPYLSWLNRKISEQTYQKKTVPFLMDINIKATKSIFKNKIEIALFVNRLLSIRRDYKSSGVTIRRTASPYFGMEANFKI